MKNYSRLASYKVLVDAAKKRGEIQTWRACIGQGGINSLPISKKITSKILNFKLPLIRIFLQQYLDVLQPDGSYNWQKMDRYIQSFYTTGAKVVAAFCLKPSMLFPEIDERIVMPNDHIIWEQLVSAVSSRYKDIVTHWEIGNETDIGEVGGCPYLFINNDQYNKYYEITAAALLRGNPQAKIGGAASSLAIDGSQLPSLIEFCRNEQVPLDFISWHVYDDDPEVHVASINRYKSLLKDWPGQKPKIFITEWSISFPPENEAVIESADNPFRTASIFSTLCQYIDENVDYSFFYHLCDNTFYFDEFRPFFKRLEIMDKDWNQLPHRFGMFDHAGKARPHYHLWRMLSELSGERLDIYMQHPDMYSLSSINDEKLQVMIANFNTINAKPMIVDIIYSNLKAGIYQVYIERINGRENMSRDGLTLDSIEERDISTAGIWRYPIYLPPYAVARIALKKTDK